MKLNVSKNIAAIFNFVKDNNLDGVFINDTDRYLNEYVPFIKTHYYKLTNFTGSTCKILILASGKIHLIVDGRYHEQADLEVDHDLVKVEKCPPGKRLLDFFVDICASNNIINLGIDGQRTELSTYNILKNTMKITSYDNEEFNQIISLEGYSNLACLKEIDENIVGKTCKEKVENLLKEGEGYYLSALDAISYLTNMRGFHLPFQSTFLSKCFVTKNGITLFNIEKEKLVVEKKDNFIQIKNISVNELKEEIAKIAKDENISKVFVDSTTINCSDSNMLRKVFKNGNVRKHKIGIISFQSVKNEKELNYIKESFLKSSKAVADTIKWLKTELKNDSSITELDFYNMANEFYKKYGAKDQSFHTIAAVGANASIIHYSKPSKDIVIKKDNMILLDSGGLYEGGYATDKTRTFLAGEEASDKQKEIYTVALKGMIQAQLAIVPDGTLGSAIDIMARTPIIRKGYNYLHSTGHGIGINTHEGGIGLHYTSKTPLKEGQLISIEPGIYISGFGGVRHENVVIVRKDKENEGMLSFNNIVFVGFDFALINDEILNTEEKDWLMEYEKKCISLGTSIML